ncbi:MAG TPA: nucleotide exchange factor GrpE [Candidatus Limnocylindria bacterium]|jgi:molecular chaperone GrpE|nr:nucleotide exchange factor GrpE [Candidatus Limnocylindria bacterium]
MEEERTDGTPPATDGSPEPAAGTLAAPEVPDETEELRQKYLYATAEMENTRKRLERRSADTERSCTRRLLLKFLPVLDNLERALAYGDSEELRSGLAATLRGFEAALESEGVEPISTAGTRFDPSVAEAIGTQRVEGVEDDTVLAETQRGYRIGAELLRPAHVIVAKHG